MSSRAAANALVKRTTFSSAINIFPNELPGVLNKPKPEIEHEIIHEKNTSQDTSSSESKIKPFAEVPGPKELPIIGNSWRFAPIIGEFV